MKSAIQHEKTAANLYPFSSFVSIPPLSVQDSTCLNIWSQYFLIEGTGESDDGAAGDFELREMAESPQDFIILPSLDTDSMMNRIAQSKLKYHQKKGDVLRIAEAERNVKITENVSLLNRGILKERGQNIMRTGDFLTSSPS